MLAQPAAPGAADVLGQPPSYTQRRLSEVANAGAIRALIWSPRLDDGWVPQGVAVGGGSLWVATYRSTDAKQSRGPCRVFRIDAADGRISGEFALPAACGHAGGITHPGGRHLYVGDGRVLYRIDTDAALAAGQCEAPACAAIALPRAWRADALAYRDGMLWFATHRARGTGTARIVQVSEQDVVAQIAAGTGALDERTARRALRIADQTQGAAVAADGFLWLAQSGGQFGRLQKVDAETGMVIASFAMPAGIEDIEFAPDGRLWTVSEAGSRRWSGWPTFYPLVFSVDTGALR